MLERFFVYGALGWCIEVMWTALAGVAGRGERDWRLTGSTYLWMFPIYGLLAPLYEPAHNALRAWPWAGRAAIYAAGFMAVELASGWLIRRLTGSCPWDYRGRARFHIGGLVRLDYAPLWALLGLGLEPVHDFLVRITPAVVAALGL
jgi:hypothetical protein